jgi:WD40 repeat protein/tRNA A-37 threonylcarbamoyl transferase component Bud32
LTGVAGRGAFGTVYKAWDPEMNRAVALKVPRRGALATAEEADRFLREARFAVQLHHANIVRVYEVGTDEGVPYLVSEFIPGRTLADHLREHRPTPERAAEILAAVADGLEHAHQKGVVHRDIKPSNILLRWNEVPVLADFGLARQDGDELTLTLDGEVLGTPAYMSPEQARGGSHRVDARTDLYSLGVVLYQLLTRQQPFVGTARMVLHQILHEEPRPPRSINDRLPRDLETVCLKCLRKDPARRYPSAAALAEDLRRFLGRLPVLARPEGRAERLARWARRNPALATASGLAAALLVATAAVFAAWAVHAERQAAAIRQALDESQRLTAESRLDRAQAEAGQGDVGAALLWMAASLEAAPASADDLSWAARANLNAWRRQHLALKDCLAAPPGRVLGFSPDQPGAWVVDAGGRTVYRWGLAAGRPDGPTLKHPGRVVVLAVSPDGKHVATSSEGLPVRIWEAAGGKLIRTLAAGDRVSALAFSPGGRGVLTAARVANREAAITAFQAWDIVTGKPLDTEFRQPGWVDALALGGDGRTLFTVTELGREVRRSGMPGGRLRDTVLRHPAPIRCLAVSPDGRHLLTGATDRAARLYAVGSDRPVAVLRHRAPISAVAFVPGGGLLTASPEDAVRSWEGARRLDPPPPERHPAKVRAVAVSPDGTRVATGADDRVVRVWELAGGKLRLLGALPRHPSPVATVAFSPGGEVLATSTHQHKGASLWDAATRRLRAALPHPARVRQVAFSPAGRLVATVGYDGAVRVWEKSGQPVAGPLGHGAAVSAAFAPDGRTLLAGGQDGAARRWDATSGEPFGQPLLHAAGVPVRAAAVSPTGRAILTLGDDGKARRWDAATGAAIGPPLGHGQEVHLLAFSPDGRTVVTGGRDNVARLWDADTGLSRGAPLRHAAPVRAVAVDPSGRWVVTASEDGTARTWELSGGRALGPPLRHDAEVYCAVIEPGGGWVVTGGVDRTARVWPAPEALEGPPGRITLWAQVTTGAELDDAGGAQPLGAAAWRDRRQRLRAWGDPPTP